MVAVTEQTWWQYLAPIQTALAALAGAAVPLIQQNGFPTTFVGWLGLLASAAGAAGLLHITAPRNQGATVIPVTNVVK
jgi:hypothetical protein